MKRILVTTPAGYPARTGLLAGVECEKTNDESGGYYFGCAEGNHQAYCWTPDGNKFRCYSDVGWAYPPKDRIKTWMAAVLGVSSSDINFKP